MCKLLEKRDILENKFRKPKDAVEFARGAHEELLGIAGVQRSRPKGNWDIGTVSVACERRYFRVIASFPNLSASNSNQVARKIFSYAGRLGCSYGYLGFGPDQVFVQGRARGSKVGGSVGLTDFDNKYGSGADLVRLGKEIFETRTVDVFLMNMIGPGHLAADVGGLTLAEAIEKGGHGTLEPIGFDRWVWQIPENDVMATRRMLLGAQMTTATE